MQFAPRADSYLDPSSPEAAKQAALKAVEESVHTEVKRALGDVNGGSGNNNLSGFAVGSLQSLEGDDATVLPEYVPLRNVPWPEPIVQLWRSFQANSTVGLFPSLCRAYITIDNRLIVWNIATGKEFISYDDIRELIIAVGEPFVPKPGVLPSHITRVIPVSTPSKVYFVGLSIIGEKNMHLAEIRATNIGYVTNAPCVIAKFVHHERSHRLFGAGADGSLYEVQYQRDHTAVQPRMRLVNHSIVFGSIPLLDCVGKAIGSVKQTWGYEKPSLRDICIDQARGMLFTLASDSTIAVYKVLEGGRLQYQTSAAHVSSTVQRTLHSNLPLHLSPLIAIFAAANDRGFHLAAVAENGDTYRYSCPEMDWQGGCRLEVRERSPSSGNRGDISGAWFCSRTFLLTRTDKQSSTDVLSFTTTPSTVMAPFQHVREVVTTWDSTTTAITRVDAVAEWSAGDSKHHLASPPNQLVVAHRDGVFFFVKLRPVDKLHAILTRSSSPQRRDELLLRFQAAYSATDYCCMLLQIASGDVSGGQQPTASNGMDAKSMSPALRLGASILQPFSHEAQRAARDLLRLFASPVWTEPLRGVAAVQRVLQVQMSSMAHGSVVYFARSVMPLWNVSATRQSTGTLAATETLLAELRRLLEWLKAEVWPDVPYTNASLGVVWNRTTATVRMNTTSALAPHEVRSLQSTFLAALVHLIDVSSQTVTFLKQLQLTGLTVEDVQLSEMVCSKEKAQAMVRSVGRLVASAEPAGRRRELSERYAAMQRHSPLLFTNVDVTEHRARMELDRIASVDSSKLRMWTPEKVREFEAAVAPTAAALWSNGSLNALCAELKSVQREDSAIKLLLIAAGQIDPQRVAWEVAQAEQAGTVHTLHPSAVNIHSEKSRILQTAISMIESAWDSNRRVAEQVLGLPEVRGSIWGVEPSDEFAHCFLFEWFLAPRVDKAVEQQLEETVLRCGSNFLADFLDRHLQRFGPQAAKYLRKVRHNYNGAIHVLAKIAQSALSHVETRDRLQYRHNCWAAALECAQEGNIAAETPKILLWDSLTNAQILLAGVIRSFLNSGDSTLHQVLDWNGREMTQREVAEETLQVIEGSFLAEKELLWYATLFRAFGGGEVKMSVLSAFQNVAASEYLAAVEDCFECRHATVPQMAERLLRNFSQIPGFPVGHVLRELEAYSYRQHPEGSAATVDLLIECGVEMAVVFAEYVDMIDHRDTLSRPCENYLLARVTDSFLCYSMSLTLRKMFSATGARGGNPSFASNALDTARSLIASVRNTQQMDPNSRRAIDAADRIVEQQCGNTRTDLRRNTNTTMFLS